MKNLLNIEQELNAILEEGKAKIVEYEGEIQIAKENKEEAIQTALKAKQGSNPQDYANAIEEQRRASDIAEFYVGKIDKIKNEPHITREQYDDYTKQIKSEMNSIDEKVSQKLIELVQELDNVNSEYWEAYTKTNGILNMLQNKIFKYSEEKQKEEARKNKTPLKGAELRNEYKQSVTAGSLRFILGSNAVKNIKEKAAE